MSIISDILTNALPCCLLALGVFLTFRLLDFADMTAEGSILIGAAISVVTINHGLNPYLATLLSMVGGACCGIMTGVLNRFLKVPKLLSGIITLTACAGFVFLIFGFSKMEGKFLEFAQLDSTKDSIYTMLSGRLPGPGDLWEILVMLVIVVIIIVVVYFFFGTEYGMAIRATGMNEKMARAQGINTTIATIVCIAISNAIIALAGSMIFQEGSQIKVGAEAGRLVIGLSSVLIGEAIFGKRTFKNWIISVALGSLVYFSITTVIIYLGGDVMDQLKKLLYAAMIIIALCLPMIKKGLGKLFKRRPKIKEVTE